MIDILSDYPRYKWVLFVIDIILINFSLYLSLHFTLAIVPITAPIPSSMPTLLEIFIYSIASLLYFQYSNLYKIQNIYRVFKHILLLLKTLLIITCGVVVFSFVIQSYHTLPVIFFANFYLINCIVFILFRVIIVLTILRFNKTAVFSSRVIIIGAGKKGKALLNVFNSKVKVKNVVGFLDDYITDREIQEIPVLGKIEDAPLLAKTKDVDFFILAIDNIERSRFFEILKFFLQNNLNLSVSSTYLQVLYDLLYVDVYDEFGMIQFRANENEKLFIYIKRTMDVIVSSIAIILLSPFLLILGILVKTTSRGSIIYKDIRIGKNGKPFYFYKFRSLLVNSDKDKERDKSVEDFIKGVNTGESESTKIVNKKNYTPIGAFIRKYSLDELPQIFNVLKGDMSLVGPRPCILKEWKMYEEWQKLRLKGMPGCTGMWQVYGRSKVDFEQSVLMDICYNQNYTPWLDLKILIKTIPVVLFGKGGE